MQTAYYTRKLVTDKTSGTKHYVFRGKNSNLKVVILAKHKHHYETVQVEGTPKSREFFFQCVNTSCEWKWWANKFQMFDDVEYALDRLERSIHGGSIRLGKSLALDLDW